jgi:uncharacterized membrane protein YhhN
MYRGLLPPVILTLAVGYLLVLGASNRTLRWFFKPAPIVLLIVLAAGSKTPDTGYKSLLVAGLTASVLGDVFLLELKGRWFMAGLSSFLIAQVLYFSAFLTRARFGMITIVVLVAIGLYTILLLRGLQPGVRAAGGQALWKAVIAYTAAISLMVLATASGSNWRATTGALLFYASDSLLAWDRFVRRFAWAEYGVMMTYYAAQFLIVTSINQ